METKKEGAEYFIKGILSILDKSEEKIMISQTNKQTNKRNGRAIRP